MYCITTGSTQNLADVTAFVEMLNKLDQHPTAEAQTLFDMQEEIVVSRAPGRLDVMGGIADYSGALVLQLPTAEATLAALQRISEPVIQIVSLGGDGENRTVKFEMPTADLLNQGDPIAYAEARQYFQRDPKQSWAAYVVGTLLVLMHERSTRFDGGVKILISSDVPEAMGVSSSAALEVAVMQAVAAAFNMTIEPRDMALLCQMVENLVVGAPCGVMDQMTAVCGHNNQLMALLCQPAELQGDVALPEDIAVWGIDSGVRHAVSGADYGSVRVGAFMGYRIIADLAGLSVRHQASEHSLAIDDAKWQGYLANVTPAYFDQHFARHLPDQMTGAAFLKEFTNTTDAVTQVETDRTYAVRTPTAHPVHEHFRVRTYAELLQGSPSERRLELLGELMYQSHASYSACGLGEAKTDRLVQLVREAGSQSGLYGAKITGGGSGGTVAVIGKRGSDAVVERIAQTYAVETGHQPHIFAGSSPGAAAFGVIRLQPS
ncbi:MAG: GHMP kinase [Chloroflexota bacterium]